MKIIDYDEILDKKIIADSAYEICNNALFPVDYQDVYNHLFGKKNLTVKLLMTNQNIIAGFGVFEKYELIFEEYIETMMYLSGMVIDPMYQGKNISQEIIKNAYNSLKSDLISLRTQNIAMAKSLINSFDNNLYVLPGDKNQLLIEVLRKCEPFEDINEDGVIKNCYQTQLYYDLDAIKNYFGIVLQSKDALGIVIKPQKRKERRNKK